MAPQDDLTAERAAKLQDYVYSLIIPVLFAEGVYILVCDFALPDRLVVFDDRADFDGDGGVGGLDVFVEVADGPSRIVNREPIRKECRRTGNCQIVDRFLDDILDDRNDSLLP